VTGDRFKVTGAKFKVTGAKFKVTGIGINPKTKKVKLRVRITRLIIKKQQKLYVVKTTPERR